jgi:NhaP-type Na+/H+ or K+/H+ antiporter
MSGITILAAVFALYALLAGRLERLSITALGLAVVTNTAVPVRIRRALNIESELNDGLATPIVTLFLAMVASEESSANEGWVAASLTQIGLAVVAALVVGSGGGWLVSRARAPGWTSAMSEQLAVLALAVLAYAGR